MLAHRPLCPGNILTPSMHWAGWYDIFQQTNLVAWQGFQELSDPSIRGQAKLVIDCCGHCQDAAELFPNNAIVGRVALPLLMALELLGDDSTTNHSWPAPAEGVKALTLCVGWFIFTCFVACHSPLHPTPPLVSAM